MTTVGEKAFFRERYLRALSIALGASGGTPGGTRAYKTVLSRVRAVSKSTSKGWKAPGYRSKGGR